MFRFTKTDIFCLSTIILFFIIQIIIGQYVIKSDMNGPIMESKFIEQIPRMENLENIEIWHIEIPKISLKASILEGTTKDILNQGIGHFENTSLKLGNVVLAAYKYSDANYFSNLKLIQKGDTIKYRCDEFEKIYEVEKCRIVKNTQVEYLEETEENMLTLITYIENQPQYRRCIQAVEKEIL